MEHKKAWNQKCNMVCQQIAVTLVYMYILNVRCSAVDHGNNYMYRTNTWQVISKKKAELLLNPQYRAGALLMEPVGSIKQAEDRSSN